MDPTANLAEQLQLAGGILASAEGVALAPNSVIMRNAERLAELVAVLDHWILAGGFLPEQWAARPADDDGRVPTQAQMNALGEAMRSHRATRLEVEIGSHRGDLHTLDALLMVVRSGEVGGVNSRYRPVRFMIVEPDGSVDG